MSCKCSCHRSNRPDCWGCKCSSDEIIKKQIQELEARTSDESDKYDTGFKNGFQAGINAARSDVNTARIKAVNQDSEEYFGFHFAVEFIDRLLILRLEGKHGGNDD
jgi:hypothetical protein